MLGALSFLVRASGAGPNSTQAQASNLKFATSYTVATTLQVNLILL